MNAKGLPPFSIIIPAYNESKGIKITLDHLIHFKESYNLEIIVVDDGSIDDTRSIAESYEIKVIAHNENRGYGAALKTGIRDAQYEIVCITDADGTYPNDMIPQMVEILNSEKKDMVVGIRTGEDVHTQKSRRIVKWAIKKIADNIVGEKIDDLNSGLRVFNKQSLFNFISILPDGFSFTTTITLGMLINNYSVKNIPINYNKRKGKSKIRPIQDTLNFLNLILKIGLYFAPLKIFLPISLFLLILSIGWGLFSAFLLHEFADASTMIIFMTGVQIAVIGFLAELINHKIENKHKKDKN
jgi:glycosyltransferase involved in cell wall biosynthesis